MTSAIVTNARSPHRFSRVRMISSSLRKRFAVDAPLAASNDGCFSEHVSTESTKSQAALLLGPRCPHQLVTSTVTKSAAPTPASSNLDRLRLVLPHLLCLALTWKAQQWTMAKDARMSIGTEVNEEFLDVATINKDTFRL